MDILVTRRLTLRPPLEVDAEAIAKLLQNTNVSRNLTNVPHPYSLNDAYDWLGRTQGDGTLNFSIHRQSLLGVIGLRPVDGHVDLGYWLGEPYWGNGYISEAARAVVAYGFRRLEASEFHSGAYQDNPASLRVLEKLGFELTGQTEHHFCPTRGEEVPCTRMKLEQTAFERRFGPLEEARAA